MLSNHFEQVVIKKLDEIRYRLPNAGGLVIAPNIEMAEYMAELLKLIEGEDPMIVHSHINNSASRINAFRKNGKRWIVSFSWRKREISCLVIMPVGLISESMTTENFCVK